MLKARVRFCVYNEIVNKTLFFIQQIHVIDSALGFTSILFFYEVLFCIDNVHVKYSILKKTPHRIENILFKRVKG